MKRGEATVPWNRKRERDKASPCTGMRFRSLLGGTFQAVSSDTEICGASHYGSGHPGLDYMSVLEIIQ